MPIKLFDNTMQGLSGALALHQQRHQVVASNLANLETPGYRAKEVDFSQALARGFEGIDPTNPTAQARAQVIDDVDAPEGPGGNTVDVDLQMAKLATNSGRYNTIAKILAKRFGLLRQAVDGVR